MEPKPTVQAEPAKQPTGTELEKNTEPAESLMQPKDLIDILLKLDDKYIQLWNFFAIPLVAVFGVFVTKLFPMISGTFSIADKGALWLVYIVFASMNIYGLSRVVKWQKATARRIEQVATCDRFGKAQSEYAKVFHSENYSRRGKVVKIIHLVLFILVTFLIFTLP